MRAPGLFIFLLLAGCAGNRHEPPQAGAPPATVAVESPPPSPTVAPQSTAAAAKPAVPTTSSASPVADQDIAENSAPPGNNKSPAKTAAPPASARQSQKKDSAAPTVSKPEAAPTLDVKSLEDKLKATKAIGVFTKLSLKNQVDDLLDKFRDFHRGQRPPTLADLRQPYELLLMKVLSLLQDGDPPLAHEISASREALWGILSDPAKFATTVGAAS